MMKRYISIILSVLLATGLTASAKKVTGSVSCGTTALSNVIVTDGYNFTTTSANGTFKLKTAADARFVYIVTPTGYTVDYSSGVPVFFQELQDGKSRYEFKLVKTSDSKDFNLFSISDPQMQTQKHFERFSEAPLADLIEQSAKYSKSQPTAAIALGDIGWNDLFVYEPYKKSVAQTGIPFYTVIGNHDFVQTSTGLAANEAFESAFGPINWAFFIGGDLAIGLKNILFEGKSPSPIKTGKYEEGYTQTELDFVKNLLNLVPADTHIFIAQHAPVYRWFKGNYLVNGEKMLSLLKGRKVDFLCGHTHISNKLIYSEDIMEHNAAAICGSWWDTNWCNDGTPRGYDIFTKRNGELSWFYHTIEYTDDFQVNILKPGQTRWHPNCVVANVWSYDPSWSVTWAEDGREMGEMTQVLEVDPYYFGEIFEVFPDKKIPNFKKPRRNNHYFTAEPSQYAKNVTVTVKGRFGESWSYDVDLTDYVDVQAHRGGAGLMPENTFSSMKNAMDMGVNTLELDLQMSADKQVVVSHDAYFHSRYAMRPDSSIVRKEDPKEYLYTMPYSEIAKYDTGLRPSEVWPEKKNMPEHKPLASELLDYTEQYPLEHGLSRMRYNIEVKSREGKGEGKNWPEYHEFVDSCLSVLLSFDLGDRLVVQCFDTRALNYMHEKYPDVKLSYLIDKQDTDWDTFMGKLDFIPEWLSPNFATVDEALVAKCHSAGMKIVPWTVDDPEDIRRMIDLKCDAIISNYPDRLLLAARGYYKDNE